MAERDYIMQICNDYIALSEKASTHISDLIKKKPDAILCLPTGSTPLLAYQLLAKKYQNREFKSDKLTIVKLDEWCGLTKNHAGSCETYLQTNVLEPLEIPRSRYIAFACDPEDPQKEARTVEETLAILPPFDLIVLGLGMNGHVGLNEPGAAFIGKVHVAKLDESSQNHPMLNDTPGVTFGMTIGFDDILRAKEILMLVSGENKADQLRRMLQDDISPAFPATNLRMSKNLRIIADRAAASKLQ